MRFLQTVEEVAKKIVKPIDKGQNGRELGSVSPIGSSRRSPETTNARIEWAVAWLLIIAGVAVLSVALVEVNEWHEAETEPCRTMTLIWLILGIVFFVMGAQTLRSRSRRGQINTRANQKGQKHQFCTGEPAFCAHCGEVRLRGSARCRRCGHRLDE